MTKFTAKSIQHLTAAGYHKDDDCVGLYLQVTQGKRGINKSWVFIYTSPITQKRREMGLGSIHDTSLKEARERARESRKRVLDGIDPKIERDQRLAQSRKKSTEITFREASSAFINSKRHEWRNDKHEEQWKSTLGTYVAPYIGDKSVNQITTEDIVHLLEKNDFWTSKNETAKRVQQRIASILDWCKARRYITGDNPAQWRGHLDKLLPNPQKVKKVRHHPALHYSKIYDFVRQIRSKNGVAARGLEFLILTATRTSEVTQAKWEEFNLEDRLWIIPQERTKTGKEYRIPLCKVAMDILKNMQAIRCNSFVFPTGRVKVDAGLSNNAFLSIIKELPEHNGITAHGFRSTFRDWAAENTNFANETVEMALGHSIKDKAEAAYRRGDQVEKRRELAEQWANYIDKKPVKSEAVSLDDFM